MSGTDIRIFSGRDKLGETLAGEMIRFAQAAAREQRPASIALSGGSTPKILFNQVARVAPQEKVNWEYLHFFWGDERCVPPDDSESNYKMAREYLLDHIRVPDSNIHRVHGEADPPGEAVRYAAEIDRIVKKKLGGFPRFDWIFLGMGADGHTASLFPGADTLNVRDQICTPAVHPGSGQRRISLTLPVINRAARISFLVVGEKKQERVAEILEKKSGYEKYPAGRVAPVEGVLEWCLDSEAAGKLRSSEG